MSHFKPWLPWEGRNPLTLEKIKEKKMEKGGRAYCTLTVLFSSHSLRPFWQIALTFSLWLFPSQLCSRTLSLCLAVSHCQWSKHINLRMHMHNTNWMTLHGLLFCTQTYIKERCINIHSGKEKALQCVHVKKLCGVLRTLQSVQCCDVLRADVV